MKQNFYSKQLNFLLVTLLLLIAANQNTLGQKGASEPYTWKSVQMVGGGFVPGIIFHPTAKGASWVECKGIPGNTRTVADRVNPKKFYAINLFEGKLFISTDGGANFTEQALKLPGGIPQRGNRGDSRGGQDRIYAAPGKEGDLWVAAFDGLYHSSDAGNSFTKLNDVQEISAFGFGKGKAGVNYSSLYLIGTVSGVRGIFRSDDIAKNWVRINDDQHQWGLLLHVSGDPKVYGRVYVGTHGRGTLYGDLK